MDSEMAMDPLGGQGECAPVHRCYCVQEKRHVCVTTGSTPVALRPGDLRGSAVSFFPFPNLGSYHEWLTKAGLNSEKRISPISVPGPLPQAGQDTEINVVRQTL